MALETPLPIDERVDEVATDAADRRELGVFLGEDFELVCTVPEPDVPVAGEAVPCSLTRVGSVTADGAVTLDGESFPDRGYDHGGE
jgi:thiamine-monophosphate kinase